MSKVLEERKFMLENGRMENKSPIHVAIVTPEKSDFVLVRGKKIAAKKIHNKKIVKLDHVPYGQNGATRMWMRIEIACAGTNTRISNIIVI